MYTSRAKGGYAEHLALEYLQSKGFKLIDKNFSFRGGELDLIMLYGDFLVFIEVKSTKSEVISIYELLSKRKKKHIAKSIYTWLNKNSAHEFIWRFDYIGIKFTKGKDYRIEHFEFVDLK